MSSIREPDSVDPSAFTTLNTGVPLRPVLRTRAYSVTIKDHSGRYALRVPPEADPQVLSIALVAVVLHG
jgi:hypothetical protein